MEAFWASLDSERPSGDDPKRVALALSRFYSDFKKSIDASGGSRWRTPLFNECDPKIRTSLAQLLSLLDEVLPTLPAARPDKLDQIRELDLTIRKATYALEQEEKQSDLQTFESPKLTQFNYLFEGWRRGLLPRAPLESFLAEYSKAVAQTSRELKEAEKQVNPRESDEEKAAVEAAVATVADLGQTLSELASTLPSGASACQSLASRVLQTGTRLGAVFSALEQCAPLKDPCPFCGGQLSLSGRCRTCGRRLPHLEEAESDGVAITSDFLSNNCRNVDLALLRWEAEPESQELWSAFQEAVREFGKHVVAGRKSLEMLAVSPDRPIDSQDTMRKKEEALKQVADAFQAALTLLSKYSQSPHPPAEKLDSAWREPLKAAELQLQELEQSTKPDAED